MRLVRWTVGIVLLACLVALGAYRALDPESRPVDARSREALRHTRAAIAVAPHQADQIRRVGASPRPVLVVWGRQDTGAPISQSEALPAAMPRASLLPVDSAGHLPYLDQPDVVVPAVVRFLRSTP
jgi:pimeloyl-ACP methyl ester carboxylesterase